MDRELLPSREKLAATPDTGYSRTDLSEVAIQKVAAERRKVLECLRPCLSKKLYYALEEKIDQEQKTLEQLLSFEQGRQQKRALYTLVLDPAFFEQRFLQQ